MASERKRQLIAEAALHRASAVLAREQLRAQVRPSALAKDAAPGFAAAALSAWFGSGLVRSVGTRLPALLPLVLPLLSAAFSRTGSRKEPREGVSMKANRQTHKALFPVVIATAAAGIGWLYRRRSR